MVVHIITRLSLGGAQQIVYELATRLQKQGERTIVLTGLSQAGPEGSTDNNLILENLVKQGVETRICPDFRNSISPIHDFKALIWLIRQLKVIHPSVVHIHSSKTGILGRFAGKIVGIPKIIFHVHGWSFSRAKGLNKMFYLTDLYIFVCLQDSRDFVANGGNSKIEDRSIVIYPGAVFSEPGLNKKKRIELRKTLGLKEDDFVIGTVARLDHQKNPEFFFRFASLYSKQNCQAKFLWIGDGILMCQMLKFITKEGLQDRVIMPGYISDVESYYSVFDIFCITSRYEGLPVTCIKALANGVPVAGFLRNGMIDLHERFDSFFGVPFNRLTKFVEAVEHARNFLQNEKKTLQRESSFVREQWNMDMMCEKIISLYHQ